tara:strand:+ start:6936 stop:7181 length:246 start_codon:yes stop_codon:yes gene_type:complete
MKIEHGDYAFKKAELQAFEVPSIDDQIASLLAQQIELHQGRIRKLEAIIENDRRLMRDAWQTNDAGVLDSLLAQMRERTKT